MTISDTEREQLLAKIDRDSLTVGMTVPNQLEVQGKVVPLHKIVYKVCSTNEVPDQFEMNILVIKRILRREMNDCIDTLQNDEITYNTGVTLVEKIGQIKRALNVLESPNETQDLETQSELSQAQDTKRWRNFVQKVSDIE